VNLFTSEQIERARGRIASDPAAKAIADRAYKSAASWLDREDALIRSIMPDAVVPRAVHINPGTYARVHATGCPVHHEPAPDFVSYPQWDFAHDPWNDPWHITCPIGGETYPSNDFAAFYATGLEDRSLLTGPYADDGYGWWPDGEPYRFWFVGYCCSLLWRTVLSGLSSLSQAYLLSEDARYAHKALVILDRLAEVYPDMDHYKQSMYAQDCSPGYDGKLFSLIGETGIVRQICTAADICREAIPNDPVFGSTAEETRSKIESGVIGGSLDGVYRGQVRGNYGMHQEAVMFAAIASGDETEIDKAVDWVLRNTGEATTHKEMLTVFDDYIFRDRSGHAEGLDFALDNLIFREGIGWESSPSYNRSWISHLTVVAELLERVGVRVWDRPKFRRMYRYPAEMLCLGKFTPTIGDSGGIDSGPIEVDATSLRSAYSATNDPFVGELLRRCGGARGGIDELLNDPVGVAPDREGQAEYRKLTIPSRLMGGYGLALLRSGKGKEAAAVSLYYGRAATEHGHFDRLVMEFFAKGRKLIPDLGYGDHASEGDPPAVWTKNTAAHTTVVVDERRQDTQGPGRPVIFSESDGLRVVEVDAPDTYHNVSEYRRTVALIDLGEGSHYVLDLFRVAGGDRHDYSFHGQPGEFATKGVDFTAQSRGTLAGEDVPYGAIYDDPDLEDPLRKGRAYYTYRGSGYSYLRNVRRGKPNGNWSATWRDAESGIALRAIFAPTDEAVLAHGEPSRRPNNPRELDYVILRNTGEGIRSRFISAIEPVEGEAQIESIEVVTQTDTSVTVKVRHALGTDLITHTVSPSGSTFSLQRSNPDGSLARLIQVGPGSQSAGGQQLAIDGALSGRVVSVAPETSSIEIERDRDSLPFQKKGLVGEVIRIHNGRRTTAYTISSVEGKGRRFRLSLDDESFRIGRFVTTSASADGSGVSTWTNLYIASQGFYRGAQLVDESHTAWLPVEDVKLAPHRPGERRDGSVELVGNHDLSAFKPGQIAYLYDFGPGDSVSITPRAEAIRRDNGSFRVVANCRAVLSQG
jgi:oligo-alginate lyase